MKRNICVVTGSRAEYGLLYWLMKDLQLSDTLKLQIIASGMHLSPEFGLTYRQIEADGFSIDARVEMLLSGDTPTAIAKSIGLGTIGFADALERLRPDLLVLLGDRFEVLSAAQAAMVARIPIAHIHGGEATEGLIDEAIRHAVTKMSHLHFVAAPEYRRRVIQLGEQPRNVYQVGAPGLDHLTRAALPAREVLEKNLNFTLGRHNFLVTYHPVTLQKTAPQQDLAQLLAALDEFPDSKLIITYPNADTQGRALIQQWHEYADSQPQRILLTPSLGQLHYLSLLREVDLVIGNSSSGLIEAPSFKKPTVNIGPRQKGRLKAASVVDCECRQTAIVAAIRRVLGDQFQRDLVSVANPYGDGHSSKRIIDILKNVDLDQLLFKHFFDVPVNP
jgi:UDP-hydrolysing UDP-N-acetyl-D-glucosamine 2-epimerase